MKKLLILSALVFSTPVFAQGADVEFMNKAILTLQQQRNSALDNQAAAEARLAIANEKLAKAEAKVKDLEEKQKASEKKPEDKKDESK